MITAHDTTTITVDHATPDPLVAALTSYAARRHPTSIRRSGSNADYKAQDLPWACFPSEPGVLYRAGVEVGGRRCPRCTTYVSVTSPVIRLRRPEQKRWWVHARCARPHEQPATTEALAAQIAAEMTAALAALRAHVEQR